jgi:hypothetical protein
MSGHAHCWRVSIAACEYYALFLFAISVLTISCHRSLAIRVEASISRPLYCRCEPELWPLLAYYVPHAWVMVGDHHQRKPTVLSRIEENPFRD